MSVFSPPLAYAYFAHCAFHAFVPSPLTSLYTPHEPSRAAWQSKWHAYAMPSYEHGTPPSCLVQPYYGGNVSPPHLSVCRSTPFSHTMAEQATKQSMTNLIFFKTH
jgi:hypothetical protein